jgi:hypothetical protein
MEQALAYLDTLKQTWNSETTLDKKKADILEVVKGTSVEAVHPINLA